MVNSEAATVFVVDDDAAVREALCSLIRSVGLQVECFASAQEFVHRPRSDSAACLVLDVRLPGLNGLELQRHLADAGDPIPIIFITGHGDIPMSVRAMKAGAAEFLPKPFRDQDLLDAIWPALERDRAARQQRSRRDTVRQRYEMLTAREREVMALVVRGGLNKQVAAELGISEITIKVHRRNIKRKMGTRSLADLVRMAEMLGPMEPTGSGGETAGSRAYTKVQ
ncbi:MAG: response regulator transcription factor [Betaproteobacteria bacterium]|nr:response regulator transcription factor [Betaproteobacteria bacterium]